MNTIKKNFALLGNMEKHISAVGRTSSGKTTLCKKLHEFSDICSIFFNTQDEDIAGVRVKKWDPDVLRKHRKINFIPSWDNDTASSQLWSIISSLREINKAMGDRSRKTNFLLWVDESHEIAYQGSKNTPVHFLFKRGNRYGITGVSITQSPADLDKAIVRQASFHIIFEVNNFESGYFKVKNIPIDRVKSRLVDHNYTIYDGRDFLGLFTMEL